MPGQQCRDRACIAAKGQHWKQHAAHVSEAGSLPETADEGAFCGSRAAEACRAQSCAFHCSPCHGSSQTHTPAHSGELPHCFYDGAANAHCSIRCGFRACMISAVTRTMC